MKKNLFILLIGIATFLFTGQVSAQSFSIGVGGGLSQVVGPDGYTKDVSEGGLGFSTEWNLGLTAKLGLPLLPIKPRAIFMYQSFSGSGQNNNLILGKGLAENDLKYSQSVITAGVGVQYNFIPVPIGPDPYIYLDLLYNNFGKLKTEYQSFTNESNSFSRSGLAIGLGTAVPLVPVVNLDLQVAYQMLNLVGKDDGEKTVGVLTLDLFVMFGN